MKKLLIFCLFIQMAGFTSSCKKETTTPTTQSTCDGSTWTYSITSTPAFVSGSIQIQYFDGNMNTVVDTTLSGTWSKSVTAHVSTSGSYSTNLTIMPGPNYYSYYPSGYTSSITMRIYKDGVEQVTSGGSGPLSFCYDVCGTCPTNTESSFNRQSYCN